jgi:hypothetical protein
MTYNIICVKVGSTVADAMEYHFITTWHEWDLLMKFISDFNETIYDKYGTDYDYDLCEVVCDVASKITLKQLEKFNFVNYARMRDEITEYHEEEKKEE